VKALIVDDEPYNVDLIRELLEAEGWTVCIAEDGSEGVRSFSEEHPDLVLMDIRMPRMNGVDAMLEIRRLDGDRHTPIVCVTARAMKGDREDLLNAGFDAYFAKPVDPWELLESIRDMMQQHPSFRPEG